MKRKWFIYTKAKSWVFGLFNASELGASIFTNATTNACECPQMLRMLTNFRECFANAANALQMIRMFCKCHEYLWIISNTFEYNWQFESLLQIMIWFHYFKWKFEKILILFYKQYFFCLKEIIIGEDIPSDISHKWLRMKIWYRFTFAKYRN